ncbi:hypothetical protein JL100_013045 [Skermanella mucosa]|nr:hypothetical protein [Skermanella mucosa]UEM23617.1 hypothetical protein JL100_013045 [Skermanella mucosa]
MKTALSRFRMGWMARKNYFFERRLPEYAAGYNVCLPLFFGGDDWRSIG